MPADLFLSLRYKDASALQTLPRPYLKPINMSDIFISYKREDQPMARKLADALERESWDVWWDPKLRAGEHFDDIIEKALDEAKCVIVIWSERSVQSRYVRDEATYALEHNKLIPLKIESVNVPFRFKGVHTPTLHDWDGSNGFPAFVKLMDDVAALIGKPAARNTKGAEGQLSNPDGRTFDIIISQPRGHGDELSSAHGGEDSWLVLIRDLTVVNRSGRDEVVSLKLWWSLGNNDVVFSPQKDPTPNRVLGKLLNTVENISALGSVTGTLLFKLPKSTVPNLSNSGFYIIIVRSQLTGIERAFNTLSFTEVIKPYPRTIQELNSQLGLHKQ